MSSEPTPEIAEDLAACPFCGPEGDPFLSNWATWFVRCRECRCEQLGLTKAEAIAAWNTRATPPKVAGDAEELAGLEAMLADGIIEQDGERAIKMGLMYAAVEALPNLIATIRASAAQLAKVKQERDAYRQQAINRAWNWRMSNAYGREEYARHLAEEIDATHANMVAKLAASLTKGQTDARD